MLHSRIPRTGLLCSPSLGVQSPIRLGEQVLIEGLGLPSYRPLCSQTPEGRRWGARGSPAEDLQLLSPSWGWWHSAQGEVPKIRASMKGALTKPFHSSLHRSPFVSHTSASSKSSSLQPGHPRKDGREGGHTLTLQMLNWISVFSP